MDKSTGSIPFSFVLLFVLSRLMSIIGKRRPWTSLLPPELLSLDLATRLHIDPAAISLASTDFGKLTRVIPAAVLYPLSPDDIVALIRFSFSSSVPFSIAARGRGHSVRGQAMAHNGVVVDMRSLNNDSNGNRINVARSSSLGWYADVGGEQLWIDVLLATLEHGLAPRSWTDYLYLTVGGTLSNAGISGQSFRHGPQISNVFEMDVITGRGELVRCSRNTNSELFYAVLGGLGQFGIITRARIALELAPTKVRWVRMLYHDFSAFTRDQEHLISIHGGIKGLDYVEGSLVMPQSPANNWRSSFFSSADHSRIASLANQYGILYSLEVAKYYDDLTADGVDGELESLLKGLSFIPGLIFAKDVSYVDFLNRVRSGELKLQSQGLWDVPHPWLNLFVPRSRIFDFDSGVFRGILKKQNKTSGPILVYPMNRSKWDDRMSAVIPDDVDDIFYSVGLLQSSGMHDWEYLENQNKEILMFCEKAGIKVKQYLPHYRSKAEWVNHLGPKWETFKAWKNKFDPKAILSPGQRIFTP
ncbi:PREDICTED: cytokinin dehydrogenase 3-like [Nelumbo nucifera]|uniref:cytokinin dehydrogenase n=1 Tax=Nelumbo nucifera TaxID=4432 RepID=A0A1U8A6H1_NELNU|nr:PREDICTED: cytokinin dehydrogenase 3-like [Nelumbo nucifera]